MLQKTQRVRLTAASLFPVEGFQNSRERCTRKSIDSRRSLDSPSCTRIKASDSDYHGIGRLNRRRTR